jgi:GT2 family glycosyltransferase
VEIAGLACELPPVSIVILTYNGSKFINGLMSSLLDQDYPLYRIEFIVVDNGSQDNTVALIQRNFPEVKCIALPRNIGFAAGNNVGYHNASNAYLVFLNQDTICHRHWLRGLVRPMLDDSQLAACVSNIVHADPTNAAQLNRSEPFDTLYFCDLSPFGYGRYHAIRETPCTQILLVSGCSFIIRREIVEAMGCLFDQRFWMYAEDTDLSLRILKLGKKICAVRDSVVFHIHGSDFMLSGLGVKKAFGAIHNRVLVYLKNMPWTEFLLYFPLLILGGSTKLLELRMPPSHKALFFIPFSVFSATAMVIAFVSNLLPAVQEKRRTPERTSRPPSVLVPLLKQRLIK